MNDACYRRIQTLRLIPKYPAKISLTSLLQELTAQGFELDKRSLQRDVKSLSNLFQIESDGNKDIPGWYWQKDAEKLELPEMEPAVALSFKMVKLFLDRFMPPSTLSDLSGYFNYAEKVLNTLSSNHLSSWSDKVALLSRNQPLLPPNVSTEILNNVYTALLSETKIKAHYQPRNEEPRDYVINPLGIVAVDQVLYVVCTLWEYDDIKQFALHRFINVELMDEPMIQQPDFSLETYIHEGHFEYPIEDENISLIMNINSGIAKHLSESRLSEDQNIEQIEDGSFLLRATVKNTEQLRWWLLGFGSEIEILEPQFLRKTFIENTRKLSKIYL